MSLPNNVPHKPSCFVFRNAGALLGKNRTGLCDCGAEQQPWQPAGNSSLAIWISSIPHNAQRYDTCGDYQYVNNVLSLTISELPSRREMYLVAIHELIEAALCEAEGITHEEIDKFDMGPPGGTWQGVTMETAKVSLGYEPGDDIRAPYYHQHQIATGIERILAAEMGVDWLVYERHIQELSK